MGSSGLAIEYKTESLEALGDIPIAIASKTSH